MYYFIATLIRKVVYTCEVVLNMCVALICHISLCYNYT